MTGRRQRYRVVLVEEPESLVPTRYVAPRRRQRQWVRRSDPLEALLEAMLRLSWRSDGGAQAWATALSDNPLTFLLDSVGDAVLVRYRDGRLAYANPAARRLTDDAFAPLQPEMALQQVELGGQTYERRAMRFGRGQRCLILEVLRRLG